MPVRLLRNALAVIGALSILAVAAGGVFLWLTFRDFHPRSAAIYWDMAKVLSATGNPAEATTWKVRVADGLSFEDVEQSIQSLAHDYNIRDVGNLPLGDQITAMRGTPWRKLKIYLYCNPLTAAKMVEYSEAYSAFLPCRIALVEDAAGALWLYTMNMDMMIEGGRPLPGAVRPAAEEVRGIMRGLLDRAAAGEF